MIRLDLAQHRFTTEEDFLTDVLKAKLEEREGTFPQQRVSDLFVELQDLAQIHNLPWPYKTPGTLTKALKGKKRALELELNVQIVLSNNHRGRQWHITITKLGDEDPTTENAITAAFTHGG